MFGGHSQNLLTKSTFNEISSGIGTEYKDWTN